jgi:hypothetical protein
VAVRSRKSRNVRWPALPASGRTAGTCTVDVDRKDGRSPEPAREEGAEKLAAAFGIKTVRDLGSNKYFAVA